MTEHLPPQDPRESNFFRFFIRQKVLVNLLMIFIFLVGGYTAVTMVREAFPLIDFDIVVVSTPYPGATAEEVEQLVTAPIERAIKPIDGIEQIDSVSVESRSEIVIKIDPDHSDKHKIIKEIENEVERVRATDLPEDGDEPLVQEINSNRPVLVVGLSGDIPELELREYARELRDDLENIPGAGKVSLFGYRNREIWVEADLKKLERNHLSLIDLVRAVRSGNHTSPGGRMEIGGEEILVRSMGKLEGSQDVSKVIVRANPEGYHLRVGDVATVFETLERERNFTNVNGKKSIRLVVTQKESGDALKIAEDARTIGDAWAKRLESKAEISYSDDITFYIQRRLSVLVNNGTSGMILVLVLLFFLLSPTSAFWTAMAIPLAYLGGLIVMDLCGYTINLLSMFSFILVSGMLVDDGIVITEFVERKREEGLSPFTAASVGVSQMAVPVIASVITTIVAFMPLAFVSGIMGKFLRIFPVVVVIILIVDLLECLFILPSHLAYFSQVKIPHWLERIRSIGPRTMAILEKIYRRHVTYTIDRPIRFVVLISVVFFSIMAVSKEYLKFRLFPVEVDEFVVNYELAVGVTLEENERLAREIEKVLFKIPRFEVESIITDIGLSGEENQQKRGTYLGQVRVALDKSGARKRSGRDILNSIKSDVEKVAKENHVVTLEFRQRQGGPPTGRAVEVHLIGEDYKKLTQLSSKVKEFLAQQSGVIGIRDNFDSGKEELRLEIDREKAARAGIPIAEVATVIRSAFDGEKTTTIRRADLEEDVDVRVKLPETDRKHKTTLTRLNVTNNRGQLVPLEDLTRIQHDKGLLSIYRTDVKRTVTVTADIDEKLTTSSAANKKLQEFLESEIKNFPNLNFKFFGEEKDTVESVQSLMKAMAVAVLIIFVVLATLFQSLTRPLIVMMVIPFAFMSVFVTLLVHGLPLSMLVLIGLTGLMGVVVNNSILIVETIHRMREDEENMPMRDILIESSVQRLRPIFLTSVTTFFGVLPLGYGIGGKEPFLAHVALTFGWGIIITTAFTVFLVPMLYSASIHVRERVGQFIHKKSSSSPA